MSKKIFSIFLLFFVTLHIPACNSWPIQQILHAGNPAARHIYKSNTIFPLKIDVSSRNKVYFSYMDTSGITINSLDIATDSLRQLTDSDKTNFLKVVSHSGNKLLFSKNCLLKCSNFQIRNLISNDNYELFRNDSIYLGKALFSKNDSVIYFVGGATFNDSSIISGYHSECQDIFSIDINGKNLKRITKLRITSWIHNFFLLDDEKSIILSIQEEEWDSDYGTYQRKTCGEVDRDPFQRGLYRFNIETLKMEQLFFTINTELNPFYDLGEITSPLVDKVSIPQKGNFILYEDPYGILKINFDNMIISAFVDSVNGEPYPEGSGPNSIYNVEFTSNGKKLVGGVGDTDNYQLVLFDIATKTIEKRFIIDKSKFIPFIK
jgi:hypothetical protein